MLVTECSVDFEKGENIIESVSNQEMQDFLVWLQKNNLLNKDLLHSNFFEYKSTHELLDKFRRTKKAS